MCKNFVGFCPGANDQALCFFGSPYLEPALNGPQKLVRILARVLLLQALHKFAPCPPWLDTIPSVELIRDSHHGVRPAAAAFGLPFCSNRWSCLPGLPGSPQTRKELIERRVIRYYGRAGLVGQHHKPLLTVADLAQQLHRIQAFQCLGELSTNRIGRSGIVDQALGRRRRHVITLRHLCTVAMLFRQLEGWLEEVPVKSLQSVEFSQWSSP